MNDDKLLTPPELAEWLKIPELTLPGWRHYGKGPRFIKIGRHVRYRRSDVEAWLNGLDEPSDRRER